MDKFFNAIYKVKKEVAWSIVAIMVGVIACCTLVGCNKEDIDKYRDITDTVIDLVDEVDELEKKIEDIIGEEAPCAPDEEASGVMMADPPKQGELAPPPPRPQYITTAKGDTIRIDILGVSNMMADPPKQGEFAPPPSSPRGIGRIDIIGVSNAAPVRPIIEPQGSVNPLNMPTYVEGLGIKTVSTNSPIVEVSPTPSVRPLPSPPSPPSPTPDIERPCLPYITPVSEIIPPAIPDTITEPILLPTDIFGPIIDIAYDYGDFEGVLLFPEFGTSPGCLFENACWNGCA